MKRRNFLSLIGAASAAPFVPATASAPAVGAAYNRYMYGLAVFHARTRASITAADLITKLRVSGATAEALMGEMSAKGVLAPAINAAVGTMRAVSPNGGAASRINEIADRAVERLLEDDDGSPAQGSDDVSAPERAETSEDVSRET